MAPGLIDKSNPVQEAARLLTGIREGVASLFQHSAVAERVAAKLCTLFEAAEEVAYQETHKPIRPKLNDTVDFESAQGTVSIGKLERPKADPQKVLEVSHRKLHEIWDDVRGGIESTFGSQLANRLETYIDECLRAQLHRNFPVEVAPAESPLKTFPGIYEALQVLVSKTSHILTEQLFTQTSATWRSLGYSGDTTLPHAPVEWLQKLTTQLGNRGALPKLEQDLIGVVNSALGAPAFYRAQGQTIEPMHFVVSLGRALVPVAEHAKAPDMLLVAMNTLSSGGQAALISQIGYPLPHIGPAIGERILRVAEAALACAEEQARMRDTPRADRTYLSTRSFLETALQALLCLGPSGREGIEAMARHAKALQGDLGSKIMAAAQKANEV